MGLFDGLQFSPLDEAIAKFEGYDPVNGQQNIATYQNNPGNLMYTPWSAQHGAIGAGTRGIAIFPDPITGASAEDALVNNYANQGFSIQDMINKWAPATDGNDPTKYASTISKQVGATPDTKISDIGKSTTPWKDALQNAILDTILSGVGLNRAATGSTDLGLWGRAAAFILGLMFIGGGLYLFKPTQNIVNAGVRTARAAI